MCECLLRYICESVFHAALFYGVLGITGGVATEVFKVTSNPSHSMMVQTCLQTTSKYKTKTEGKMDQMASC